MDRPFCMHVLCLFMKYMHEKRVVHYRSVYGKLVDFLIWEVFWTLHSIV